jgi:chromosome segregation protein
MYLKRLEIHGFKSFADRVEIEFGPGMTVVVGPNGCGKSNLTEAVQWVLGEQSARALRGYKMEDVIFSGSAKRRSLGMGEVTLTFDNSSHFLPIPFEEVSISRRVYRDGVGEYLINKTSCRLRDIQELFASCGISRAAFSIIAQGKIDELLSVRPEERRYYLEEVAGVSKYRQRKNDAIMKMDETEQSLLRIQDILLELEHQKGPLAEQTKVAEQYQLYNGRLKELEIRLLEGQFYRLRAKKSQLLVGSQRIESVLAVEELLKDRLDRELSALQIELQGIQERVRDSEERTVQLEKQRHELGLQKVRSEEKKASEQSRARELEERLQGFCLRSDKVSNALSSLESEMARDAALQEQMRAECNSLEIEKESLEAERNSTRENLDSNNRDLFDILHEKTSLSGRIKEIAARKELLKNQQDNLNNKAGQGQVRIKELQILINQEKAASAELLADLAKRRQDLEQAQKLAMEVSTAKQLKTEAWRLTQQKVETLQTHLRILQDAEDRQEGYQKGVRDVLRGVKQGNPACQGIIGLAEELFTVDKQYETAIDVALGRSGQYLVCTTPEAASGGIRFLKEHNSGRATFLPLASVERWADKEHTPHPISGPEVIGRASDLVTTEERYRKAADFLLGHTYVTSDLHDARSLAEKNYYRVRVVTMDGELIQPGGLITGGKLNQNISITRRRRQEISGLTKELQQCLQSAGEIRRQDDDLNSRAKVTESGCRKLEQEQHRLEESVRSCQQKISLWQEEWKQLEKYTHSFTLEVEEQGYRSDDLDQQVGQLKSELEAVLEAEEKTQARRRVLSEQQQRLEDDWRQMEQKGAAANLRLSSCQQDMKHIKHRQDEMGQSIEQQDRERHALETALQAVMAEVDSREVEIATIREKLVALDRQMEKLNSELTFRRRQYQHKAVFRQAKDKRDQRVNQVAWKHQQQLHNTGLQCGHLDEQIAELSARSEELGVEIESDRLIRELTRQEEAQARDRMLELKQLLAGIGAVNFAAPGEFRVLQERYDYLKQQKMDLEDGKLALQQVIKEMDQAVTSRFYKTYLEVKKNFAEIFAGLCEGGTAELFLTDEENLLTAGLDMNVLPRGKKPRHLSLLSGGERALTGIAFLFALLRTKPSPFYLLDEIEAALDEANLLRFADFLKKMGESCQLVLISHRYQTMQAAGTLYGITMEEPGVSKLVSVKLTEDKAVAGSQ